jgi:alpha-L-fucosidase
MSAVKPYRMLPVLSLCLATVCLSVIVEAQAQQTSPKYEPTWKSLKGYETAEWFRNAKFGIFIHWGAYSVPAFGSEWYPREMYQQGSAAFNHHVATYGPQSKFGYKDLVARFRAEKWNPEEWADLFLRSGAKYVVPVAEHHDGFAMYDCSLCRWNAVKMGPKRDIIGELAFAVRKRGLIFGLSSHRAEHWWFMNPGRSFDSDVNDSAFADLYGPAQPDTIVPVKAYLDNWYARCVELVDKYKPQVFYFDWWIEQSAFASYLQQFAAYYYNKAGSWKNEVVINYKNAAFPDHTAVLDIERGRLQDIRLLPWQTDTSVGKKSWGYIENEENKSADELVDVLVDIVSKNGCLLLNIGPRADGTIPEDQQKVLRDMGNWLSVNGEAIYNTRPWELFGEGITPQQGGMFSELRSRPYTSEDIRFTTRGANVYAIVLGWPGESCWIRNLRPRPDSKIRLLGYDQALEWEWVETKGLHVRFPAGLQQETRRPCQYAYALRIEGTRARVLAKPAIRVAGRDVPETYVFPESVAVGLQSEISGTTLLYSLDGSSPTEQSTRYTGPFTVTSPTRVRAVAVKDGFVQSLTAVADLRKAENVRSITYKFPYSAKYQADGDLTLADGEQGSVDFQNGKWLGFEGVDADFLVELKDSRAVRSVRIGFLENQDSWIFFPQRVEVSVSSDGTTFQAIAHVDTGNVTSSNSIDRKEVSLRIGAEGCRFLRIQAKNIGLCPVWHKGAGGKAWLFLDEVEVE